MSDKAEASDSNQGSQDEERGDSSKVSSLKDATHKLKAEALRRLQLEDADYGNEGAKNEEARHQDQNDENAQEGTDISDEQGNGPEISDIASKETNLAVSDQNGGDSNVDETRERGGFDEELNSAKTEDVAGDSSTENVPVPTSVQNSDDVNANKGGDTSGEIKNQSTKEQDASVMQEGHSKENVTDAVRKDSRPSSSQGQEGTSIGSRPGSSGARPGSGSKGAGKGEGTDQKLSSRPGSSDRKRSRPGSRSGSKGPSHEVHTSSRPGSGARTRSRPQSGSKREAVGGEVGVVKQDVSSGGVAGETITGKDGTSVGNKPFKSEVSLSQSDTNKEAIKENDSISEQATSSSNIIEGGSQTTGANSVEQGKEPHGDTSNLNVNDKSPGDTFTQVLSDDNKFASEQREGDDDKISDEVSPPMNEGSDSTATVTDSKQGSDSLSNKKQDPGGMEAGEDAVEGKQPESTETGKEKSSSSEQAGQGDPESSETGNVSQVSQGEDSSKDKNIPDGKEGTATSGGKDGFSADAAATDQKTSRSVEAQGSDEARDAENNKEKAETEAADGGGKKDDHEGDASVKQRAGGEKSDAEADKTEGKKEEGGEKKKKKKKVKKESTGQEEEVEGEEDDTAEETEKAVEEPNQTKPTQSAPGKEFMVLSLDKV